MKTHSEEIAAGERFEFGANWQRFLAALNEESIASAEQSLRASLQLSSLRGLAFLDVGSGSGLFSLAARRMGARVHSLDYDPRSVACALELRRRYFPDDPQWSIEQGSALDREYLSSLGQFDIVYSWGVLHHTGSMWQALENVVPLVRDGGRLFISIYNDQGGASRRWTSVKKLYNKLPPPLRFTVLWPSAVYLWTPIVLRDLLRGRPLALWTNYRNQRGMTPWRDLVDWVGGYPFEVASPEAIFNFYHPRGFQLKGLTTRGGGLGCNEFVFVKGS